MGRSRTAVAAVRAVLVAQLLGRRVRRQPADTPGFIKMTIPTTAAKPTGRRRGLLHGRRPDARRGAAQQGDLRSALLRHAAGQQRLIFINSFDKGTVGTLFRNWISQDCCVVECVTGRRCRMLSSEYLIKRIIDSSCWS